MVNVLNLNLKKKWFDLILSGVKKEEYRDLKPLYFTRLTNSTTYPISAKKFDAVRFMNGMAKDAPVFTVECKGIDISTGRPEWGAEPGTEYFRIKLGAILETRNIK